MKTILIIENDKSNLFALEYCVKDLGVKVLCSESLIPLDEIPGISPSVILLDHWLDHETGGAFCKLIKADAQIKHVPVLMISAHPHIAQIAKMSGADDFLPKPFDIHELRQKVEQYLR